MSMQLTQQFWNASPCGGQENFQARFKHRYSMEPWIPLLLNRIAQKHAHILEIGCGQGTDGLYLCSKLPVNSVYVGIDYSNESIAQALNAHQEAPPLNVVPSFQWGNAEQLDAEDESVECIYSLGVIHHTANDLRAFEEIYRVLKPGGSAYIALYRKGSPKVSIAKGLRALQWGVDKLTHKERSFYRLIYGNHWDKALGTMLLECFGVPYLKCYSTGELRRIFKNIGFSIISISPIGYNLPHINPKGNGLTPFGYFLLAELEKPVTG